MKNSTLLIVPSESEAFAVITIVAGAVNVLPLEGDVIVTEGFLLEPDDGSYSNAPRSGLL